MGRGKLLADGTVNELISTLDVKEGQTPTLEDLFLRLTGSSDEVLE